MTPAAHIAAAIEILDVYLSGTRLEQAASKWARDHRFAGSGDRAAIRDLVYTAVRRRRSYAELGGGLTGRGLMLGHLRAEGRDPTEIFTAAKFAPEPMTAQEAAHQPSDDLPPDMPDWLLPLWESGLDTQAKSALDCQATRARVWLRVNEARCSPDQAQVALRDDNISTRPAKTRAGALEVIDNSRRVAGSRAYREGLVELQDLAVQEACDLVQLSEGQKVLDYCAGAGGKSLALAARGADAIWAHDANPSRMADLPVRAQRAGAKIAIATARALSGQYDLVLADVPCSGSGTWRRDPEGKWALTPKKLADLVSLQAQIMDEAACRVQSAGHFVYMTCSVFAAENAAQVESFLNRHQDFALHQSRAWVPDSEHDGFFCAIFERD